jgi:undecaprenyl-diphosphatase
MDKLRALDEQLFVYLNNLHATFLDQPMYYMSRTYLWIPLHLYLLYIIIKHYGKESWVIIVCIALSILMADQFTSGLMKPFFSRLRPSHEAHLESAIHIVNNAKGGLYGFASSHAANTFALAFFIWLLFKDQYKYISLIFLWAILVCYTRIYLGMHYPGDLLAGAIVGLISGYIGYRISVRVLRAIHRQNEVGSA